MYYPCLGAFWPVRAEVPEDRSKALGERHPGWLSHGGCLLPEYRWTPLLGSSLPPGRWPSYHSRTVVSDGFLSTNAYSRKTPANQVRDVRPRLHPTLEQK